MKLRLGLLAVLLAATAMVGCAPTEDDYKNWASENGYVQNPDYAGWAEENGYVQNPDYAGWAEENGYSKLAALPAARLASGKGTYNVADSGIQLAPAKDSGAKKALDYFDREDAVYIDLRDAKNYTLGHIEGFEWVPHFDLIMASDGSKGQQLFWTDNKGTKDTADDEIKATYEESKAVIEAIFPKDKTIFLMCQSGGRVVSTMNVLKACGYNMDKVYNIGGWNQISKDASYPKTKCESATVTATYTIAGLTPVA